MVMIGIGVSMVVQITRVWGCYWVRFGWLISEKMTHKWATMAVRGLARLEQWVAKARWWLEFPICVRHRKCGSVLCSYVPDAVGRREGKHDFDYPGFKINGHDGQFPPQVQQEQPGKEHVMDPTPQAVSHNYKASNKLQGKVALVTGGDSGIGRAVCLCYAMKGATVAFTYVKSQEEKDAKDTLHLLKQAKPDRSIKDPIAIPADLGFENNCRKVIEEVVNTFGTIDILVNNAAEQHVSTDVTELTEEQLDRVFRTNIFSYFFATKYAMKYMKEGGCVINTTSVTAYKGSPTLLDYTSTKGAIVAFTRGLAMQVVGKGIRVNGVAPGPVWTPLIPASFPEEKVERFGSEVPMKRAGQPYEIAPSYVFLGCEDSSYFTGQVLHPNGGVIVNG